MTPIAQLYALHLRLTLDRSSAFAGDINAGIKPTPAGKLWHRDHARYKHLWSVLERDGHDLPKLLEQRFGYVLEDEIAPEDEPTPAA